MTELDQAIVYGLHDGDGVIRYVGCTTQGLEKRVSDHMGETRYRIKRKQKLNEKQAWIAEVLSIGTRVEGTILFTGTQDEAFAQEELLTNTLPNLTNASTFHRHRRPVGSKDTEETKRRKSEAWQANYEERRAIIGEAQRDWRLRRPEKAAELGKNISVRWKAWLAVPENMDSFKKNMSKAQLKRWAEMSADERERSTQQLQAAGVAGGINAGIRRREKLGYPFPKLSVNHSKNLAYHLERKKK